ncbi:MAG: SUMF1/EgtB/PvdO family nonheme iron enzyme [Planctomycetes bacterium]|nr:SUMF1/EgtB/PvdO family nonheme iron enzyme [Planctomycetota bacterium]
MKTTSFALLITSFMLAICLVTTAHADPFGSGVNAFDIDFVTIGNPGNAPDDISANPDFAGSVAQTYRIGQFEISEDMIDKANTLGGLGITHNNRGANKPATNINWFEAAQFVNWLNIDSGSTEAYKFNGSAFELWQPGDTGYNPDNLYRNSGAKYFLPSADEWYKAAFYNPAGAGSYGDYPTANGLVPTAVASGTAANTAVFAQSGATGPADITQAGGLSPYGTMGQGGNVYEWEETAFLLVNDLSLFPLFPRGVRGGSWRSDSSFLSSSDRSSSIPSIEGFHRYLNVLGFRVASIPEPSSVLLGAMAAVGLLMRRRRVS